MLSVTVFDIAIEPLAKAIRSERIIRGITGVKHLIKYAGEGNSPPRAAEFGNKCIQNLYFFHELIWPNRLLIAICLLKLELKK